MSDTLLLRSQRWASVRLGTVSARRRGLPAHLAVGERGEQESFFYLRRVGFTVVARRWNSGRHRGDLDLVAWEGDVLCVIEVKTRSLHNPLDPAEAAVDRDKRRVLRRLAESYLRQLPEALRRTVPLRFDILSVYLAPGQPYGLPTFDLLRNAFARQER